MITRRFLASESLQTLLNFVASKRFATNDHKLLTTYPRRDVSRQRRGAGAVILPINGEM